MEEEIIENKAKETKNVTKRNKGKKFKFIYNNLIDEQEIYI